MTFLYYLAAFGYPNIESKYNILSNNLNYIYNNTKQNFDLLINCYSIDIDISKFINKSKFPFLDNIYIHFQTGILFDLWVNNPYHEVLKNYDYIFFILDDVEIVSLDIYEMVDLKKKYNIEFISPRVENATWDYMRLECNNILRITNRIEIYFILMDYNNFQTFLKLNSIDNPHIWGVDLMMGHYKIKTAIYYKFSVNHKLISNSNSVKACNDMIMYLNKHGYRDLNDVLEKLPYLIETIYVLPDDFSPEIYTEINSDILNNDFYKNNIAQHYIDNGINENRIYKYSQIPIQINIFLLCYNESALLPHTINHYKTYLPSCKITIYDNESTDNSVEIAKTLGCNVISWNSSNKIDDFKYIDIKNNCWKHIEHGWIIVADMDEYLCVTEDDLRSEIESKSTILTVKGINMIGESETVDLTDINLQHITSYLDFDDESKNLCFFRNYINNMNYDLGAHKCSPTGLVKYSKKTYYNKHMCYLGLKFIINKMINRFKRSDEMRNFNLAVHYTDDITRIQNEYNYNLHHSKNL